MTNVTFKAVNWNLGNGQNVRAEALRPVAVKQKARGVTIFGLNEFSPGARKVWRDLGYTTFGFGSNACAFDPTEWRRVRGLNTKPGRVLTDIVWRRSGGAKVRGTMTKGLLVHKETGFRLRVGVIHPPAGVQDGGGPSRKPADQQRLRQYKAIMSSLGGMVRRWMPKKAATAIGKLSADAVLVFADDNSDESRAPKEWRPITGYRNTQLRQIQPPEATHGGGRGIDPFYLRGLNVLAQWVTPNPSDHHLHGGEFEGTARRGDR